MNSRALRRRAYAAGLSLVAASTVSACGSSAPTATPAVTAPPGPPVTVPRSLIGQTVTQATRGINLLGLTVSAVRTKVDRSATPGTVVGVLDERSGDVLGGKVTQGSPVVLVYAPGPDNVTMPILTGLTEYAVEATLTSSFYHFSLTFVHEHNALKAGKVVTTEPAGGAPVAPGSAVVVHVSSGP
jgi:serine/threonine-protein kinase